MKRVVLATVFVLLTATLTLADTIYLRDGRIVDGTLLGFINGRFAVKVSSIRVNPTTPGTGDEGKIMLFRPSDVQRIEIDGRSLDDMRYETRTVEVSLASNWIDTGVDLRRNERVRINATGTIVAGRSRITPDGLRSTDRTAPLPRAAEGTLIGSVGEDATSPIIELGSGREFVADRDGRLYLTANRGSYTDARGAFSVQIRKERDLATLEDEDSADSGGPRAPRRARPRSRIPGDSGRDRGPQEVNIEVAGTSRSTDTNLDVRAGDQITFTASGRVIAGRRIGEVGPEGAAASGFGAIIASRPVPAAGPGALIGYVRMADGQIGQPFLIGNQLTFSVPVEGRLFLAINDDNYSDNGGSFTVKISLR